MLPKLHRIVLFANGDFPCPNRLNAQLDKEDFLIAVDGGLNHMTALNLTPALIIGDLDSANPEEVKRLQSQGVEIRSFPPEKNETDLELALDAALKLDPAVIWIVGALGNRLDQTLANIFLLTQPKLAGIDVRLVDGTRQVFLIRKSALIEGIVGQRLSLLPLNGPVVGVRTAGLAYPLEDETLYPDRTRGISNYLTGSSAKVIILKGLLLCVHQITDPLERST